MLVNWFLAVHDRWSNQFTDALLSLSRQGQLIRFKQEALLASRVEDVLEGRLNFNYRVLERWLNLPNCLKYPELLAKLEVRWADIVAGSFTRPHWMSRP